MPPLAYLITWTTYGSWLSGDERGWVIAGAKGIRRADGHRRDLAESMLKQEPVLLDDRQRRIAAEVIEAHCAVRHWTLWAHNVLTNHVHVVVTAAVAPEKAMGEFKAWAARRLNEQRGKKQLWWTRHGSTRWINDESYLQNAIRYVLEGQ